MSTESHSMCQLLRTVVATHKERSKQIEHLNYYLTTLAASTEIVRALPAVLAYFLAPLICRTARVDYDTEAIFMTANSHQKS